MVPCDFQSIENLGWLVISQKRDIRRLIKVSKSVISGMIGINTWETSAFETLYGGIKESEYGMDKLGQSSRL